VYTHVPLHTSYEIPTEYDPNLALAIIWGADLEQAKQRGITFLEQLQLEGRNASGEPLRSNVEYLKDMTANILLF
jgi:acetyl/propionyl-CoA carboxylase alpha subunit